MRIILSYPTEVGIFDIGQSKDKKYHVIFDDESISCQDSVQSAVDSLLTNSTEKIYNSDTKELIDTSKLGIPQNYTEWDSNY